MVPDAPETPSAIHRLLAVPRHVSALLSPTAFAWGRVGLERNQGQRLERMASSARDRMPFRPRPALSSTRTPSSITIRATA